MTRQMKALILGVLLAASFSLTAWADEILIQGGTVHTMVPGEGRQGRADTDILIRDGSIVEVGSGLAAADGATVIDAAGKVVTPGLFSSYTQLGIEEISLDEESNDSRPEKGFELGAALDVQTAINPASTLIPAARLDGLTHAVVAPVAGNGIFAGSGAVMALSGEANSVAAPKAALFAEVFSRGVRLEGGSRMTAWATLGEYLGNARDYARNPVAHIAGRHRGQRLALADLKALVPVVSGEQKLALVVQRAADIRQALQLKAAFELDLVILGAREAWMVADELKAAEVPVVVDPYDNLPSNFESLGATLENAARLHKAGVRFAFAMTGDPAHRAGQLAQLAGNAVAHGLPWKAGLAAVTRSPAQIWGLDASTGTIETGKEANIVIWDGDPLEVTSNTDAVLIRGRMMPMTSRQSELRERYRDLDADRPFGYR